MSSVYKPFTTKMPPVGQQSLYICFVCGQLTVLHREHPRPVHIDSELTSSAHGVLVRGGAWLSRLHDILGMSDTMIMEHPFLTTDYICGRCIKKVVVVERADAMRKELNQDFTTTHIEHGLLPNPRPSTSQENDTGLDVVRSAPLHRSPRRFSGSYHGIPNVAGRPSQFEHSARQVIRMSAVDRKRSASRNGTRTFSKDEQVITRKPKNERPKQELPKNEIMRDSERRDEMPKYAPIRDEMAKHTARDELAAAAKYSPRYEVARYVARDEGVKYTSRDDMTRYALRDEGKYGSRDDMAKYAFRDESAKYTSRSRDDIAKYALRDEKARHHAIRDEVGKKILGDDVTKYAAKDSMAMVKFSPKDETAARYDTGDEAAKYSPRDEIVKYCPGDKLPPRYSPARKEIAKFVQARDENPRYPTSFDERARMMHLIDEKARIAQVMKENAKYAHSKEERQQLYSMHVNDNVRAAQVMDERTKFGNEGPKYSLPLLERARCALLRGDTDRLAVTQDKYGFTNDDFSLSTDGEAENDQPCDRKEKLSDVDSQADDDVAVITVVQ